MSVEFPDEMADQTPVLPNKILWDDGVKPIAITLSELKDLFLAAVTAWTSISDATDLDTQLTEIALSISQQDDTWFISWSDSWDYWSKDDITWTFTLLRWWAGRVDWKTITWSWGQSIFIPAWTTQTIYIDSNWDIQISTDLSLNVIKLFTLWRNDSGTIIRPVKENHPYSFDRQVSRTLHRTIGTVFTTDSVWNLTFDRVTAWTGTLDTDREIKSIWNGTVEDHWLTTDIEDSLWLWVDQVFPYLKANWKWETHSESKQLPMVYNDAWVITAIWNWKYWVFKWYSCKDSLNVTTPTIFWLMWWVQYNTLWAAQAAITADQNNETSDINSPTAELANIELTRLWYAIVENNASWGFIEEVITDLQTIQRGWGWDSGWASTANAVTTDTTNFDKNLSAADTNVQLALETIDELDLGWFDFRPRRTWTIDQNIIMYEWIIGKAVTLSNWQADLLVAPTWQDLIVTISKSTDQWATYPTSNTITVVAWTRYKSQALTLSFVATDYIKVEVTQVWSTVKWSTLNLVII